MATVRPTTLQRCLCALVVAFALLMLLGAAGAQATPVTLPGGQKIQIEPQILTSQQDSLSRSNGTMGQNPNPSPLNALGGPVLHNTKTYAIYWDPTSTSYPQSYPGQVKLTLGEFLQDVGADTGLTSNVFAINGQYTDSTGRAAYNSTFRGAYSDVTAFPAAGCNDPNDPSGSLCLTAAQVQSELQSVITSRGLPQGLNYVYFLMTPPNVVVCTDAGGSNCSGGNGVSVQSGTQPGFCAYHSYLGSGLSPYSDTTPYAVVPYAGLTQPKSCQADGEGASPSVPWIQLPNEQKQVQPIQVNANSFVPSYADVLVSDISHELNGVMTDPLLNGWQDSTGQEAPDKCVAQSVGGQAVSNGFDPFAWPVLIGGTGQAAPAGKTTPQGFPIIWGTLYNSPIAGDLYWLHGEWNNAERNCELSVQLTPKFVSSNPVNSGDLVGFDATPTLSDLGVATYYWNFGDGTNSGAAPKSAPSIFHAYSTPGQYSVTLTVTDGGGYSASASQQVLVLGTPPAPGAGAGAATGGGPGGSGAAGASGSVIPPSVSESIVSRSVSRILRGGVAVRYSVNQTVAGHFQVLLNRRVANRLHITGSSASGFGSSAHDGAIVIGYALLVASRAGNSSMSISLTRTAAKRLAHTHSLQIAVRVLVSNDGAHTATVTQIASLGR